MFIFYSDVDMDSAGPIDHRKVLLVHLAFSRTFSIEYFSCQQQTRKIRPVVNLKEMVNITLLLDTNSG